MNRKHFGCLVIGCSRVHESKGYCKIHANQIRKYGKTITGCYSYKTTKNNIKCKGSYCIMDLCDKLGTKVGETLFDTEFKTEIERYKWYLNNIGYVYSGKGGYLHRLILHLQKGEKCEVDHKNGNKLDNRKTNIRKCTRSQNMINKEVSCTSRSGYKGVSFLKNIRKWMAYITENKKRKYLGCFDKKEEAAIAYNEAAIELYGEFAKLNLIRRFK
jgi:hypothetical protein